MNTSPSSTRYRYRYVKRGAPNRLHQALATVAVLAAVLCFGLVLLSF